MEIEIREQRLPGIGQRYEFAIDGNERVVVVAQRDGRRDIGVLRSGSDQVEQLVQLDQDQAVALGAMLTGARFSIDTSDDDRIEAGRVVVQTVTLGHSSPVLGRTVKDIDVCDDIAAAVLAVIRDETPQVVEDPATAGSPPGDRLVIAADRDHIDRLVAYLSGAGDAIGELRR